MLILMLGVIEAVRYTSDVKLTSSTSYYLHSQCMDDVDDDNYSNLYYNHCQFYRGGSLDLGHVEVEDINQDHGRIARLTLDGASCARLFVLSFYALSKFTMVFVGTLRLLAPLIVARRVLVSIGHFFTDYATGRYFRKTYTRLERAYMHYYELPAAMRSLSRCVSLVAIYIVLSKVIARFSGCVPTFNAILPHVYDTYTQEEGRQQDVTYLCSALWVGTVVWIGHTVSSAIAIWGGPLRIQAAQHHQTRTRPTAVEVFTRPRHILQLMAKPDEWLSTLSMWTVPGVNYTFDRKEPFAPNRLFFPSTWRPLKFIQICAVAKVSLKLKFSRIFVIFSYTSYQIKIALGNPFQSQ